MAPPAGDFPLTFDPTLPAGPHNLTVVYTDTFGQTAEQTISFTTPEPLGQCNGTMDITIIYTVVLCHSYTLLFVVT